jgi:poly-gamma-glutamate synthesis protein (capsule biosynthesis protein)
MRRLLLTLALIGVGHRAYAQNTSPTAKVLLLGQSIILNDPRGLMDAPLGSLLPMMRDADVVFTNFEGAVKGAGCICKPMREGVFQHAASPDVFDFLKFAHVNLISLANNHSWDLGVDGVVSTMDEAVKRGMVVAGAGHNVAEAMAPGIITVNGIRIALVAMATVKISDSAMATATVPGMNLLRIDNTADWDRNIAAIKAAKKQADVVIVYQHFQTVGTPEWQRRWAHAAIDAGGTVYVAHGEPQLFGAESYKGKPVLYGLGNFIFQTKTEPGHYPQEVWEAAVAELTVGKGTVSSVRFTPILVKDAPNLATRGFPVVAADSTRDRILDRLAKLSREIGSDLKIENGAAVLLVR